MKKTVVRYGLISGGAAILLILAVIPLVEARQHAMSDVIGYSSMIVSALLVFFGVRSYREHVGGGRITFARGLAVGLSITLISCACAVVAFQVIYFGLVPGFGETFAACMVERVSASGGTAEQVERASQQAQVLKRLYDNPLTNAALTFAMSFPIGLAGSLISAAILRRR